LFFTRIIGRKINNIINEKSKSELVTQCVINTEVKDKSKGDFIILEGFLYLFNFMNL